VTFDLGDGEHGHAAVLALHVDAVAGFQFGQAGEAAGLFLVVDVPG
jgi:hypothetical protein